MIRIIGIGSPFGDDAAGLVAARHLALAQPPATEVVAADRPGVSLIDLLDGAKAVILIDAAQSGSTPGMLHDIDLNAVAHMPHPPAATHGFGVADALALAKALGRVPAYGRILAIEIPSAGAPMAGDLTPAVRAGVAAAVARATEWLDRWRDRPPPVAPR